jgi:hypothetical protein
VNECVVDETRGFDPDTKEWTYQVECVRTDQHDCDFVGWEMFRIPQAVA